MSKVKIGFIGAGVMGSSMIRNLLKAGYAVSVYTRTRSKAEPLADDGAEIVDTVQEAASGADFVITIVGFPKDVEEVYLSDNGILKNLNEGAVVIDMTTSSPALAREIHEKADAMGAGALDAPVSGGDMGARNGTLSIMVGGDETVFKKSLPVFEAMGKNIVYQGKAGSGQFTKMANQIAIASGMLGVCEAMHYAKASGLDPFTVLKSIESGAAGSWSLSNLIPRALKGDFAPGFYVKHFLKDMRIAIESASAMGLNLPGLEMAIRLYEILEKSGYTDCGTQALFDLYEKGLHK